MEFWLSIFELDDNSMALVIIMSLAGSYYVHYMFNELGAAVMGFFSFVATSMLLLAAIRWVGWSMVQEKGGDAIIGTGIAMILVVVSFILMVAVFRPKDKKSSNNGPAA